MTAFAWVSVPASRIGGSLSVPGDKSVSHRALLLGSIAAGPIEVDGFLDSADCRATRAAVEALGVRVESVDRDRLRVTGPGPRGLRDPEGPLDMGNSGTGIRLLTGLLAGLGIKAELTGDASLRSRPMERIAAPLRQMGAQISASNGHPPIRLGGPARPGAGLTGIDYTLPVASAQVKSAILLAGLSASGTTVVRQPAVSRDHTERMLQSLGAPIVFDQNHAAIKGPCVLSGGHIGVPADFSSAAFFLVAGLLRADEGLLIRGVGLNPTRTGLLDILRMMGARIEIRDQRQLGAEPVADLWVQRSDLQGIDVPPELVPLAIDEFPVLFVAAAAAHGLTRVRGAAELRVKESDRIAAMARALAGVGVSVHETDDGMDVEGGSIGPGSVDSEGDHRVAMSMAVAGLAASGPIQISDISNVDTSFPGFAKLARSVGFPLRVNG
ncbi:MAG: 3-phosphoshikimate 1-carboxyvinyltransferase [Gammaproteobacteria bacterium]